MTTIQPWIPYNPMGGALARWKGHVICCCVCGTEDVLTYTCYGKLRKRNCCREHFNERQNIRQRARRAQLRRDEQEAWW